MDSLPGFSRAIFLAGIAVVLCFLVGRVLIKFLGERSGKLFWPDDSHFRILPEYSVAEARVNEGRYPEAIAEYRQVIAKHPDDIYPHLRIAELALNHLNDVKLAERELALAVDKARGDDSRVLAANRLADFYQHTLHDPARALKIMQQLCERIPNTKQAKLAEERIVILKGMASGAVSLPQAPDKVSIRPSRYKMPE